MSELQFDDTPQDPECEAVDGVQDDESVEDEEPS